MMNGKMIVCDGSNGAGKSTIINAIKHHLVSLDKEVVITREPGGTPIGEKLREILLDKNNDEMCNMTELMLFAAGRAQHLNDKILPALKKGKVVVSDRFDSATVSFQHYARGLSLRVINQLNDLALNGFRADMTIILDLDPVTGLERICRRDSDLDRMEREDINFLVKARNGYLEQAKNNPGRFTVINASKPVEQVITEVLSIVDEVIAA